MVKKLVLIVTVCFCLLDILQAADKPVMEPQMMTPLVGRNCVINQIDKSLVELLGGVSALGNIVDVNTSNYASFSSLAGVDVAYHQILSIKDTEHEYKGGTETGFVMQSTSGSSNLLTVDVLKMFVVETYLNGEKQESSVNTTTESGLLNLNLITIATDGKTKVSIKTTKKFDEVRLAITGVNADAFSNLKLFYAYVGENEIQPITKTKFYTNASVHSRSITGLGDSWTTAMWNRPNQKEKLVGVNSENEGVGFGTLGSLLTEPRITIHAGKTIPANTEIGFVIETGSVLAINILNNTVLTTYDANNKEVESKKIASVLGLSAISGGRTTVSMITTQPCQQIKIKFGGLNVDVGGTKIFYAYTRSTELDVKQECDLKLSSDISICNQSAIQLNGVDGIIWSIEEQPAGANATVSSTGLVENMTVPGAYTIKAQKGDCIDYVVINNSPISQVSSECNRPIVGTNIAPFSPAGGGCLLCLSPDLDNGSNNVVDEDLTNYVEYTKGLDLLSNTSIYGVQRTDNQKFEASTQTPRRVGFIMQATDQFLTADILKFFVIKTYLGENVQESSPVEENDVVGANLIGGMSNQMRFSFVATKPFDRVTIWTAGVLSLNLSKFRIYYAFEEPASSTCMAQYSSGGCLSLLSTQHGASLNYERTGFDGVANVGASMRNLANVLDGSMGTYAYINKTAGVAANTTLSVKANQVFKHGYQAGFVVEEQTWIGNVDLLRSLKIKTFLNGVATGDEAIKPEVLSLDLIGSFGKSLVAITPTQEFDEIQLDMSGLLDALVELKVYGAFVQPDTDNDGIPDCMDKNPCGVEFVASSAGVYCVGDQVNVTLTGWKDNVTYTLWDGTESYSFESGVATYTAETAGQFNCTVRENGVDVYTHLLITVHPLETQWTGAVSTDWNDWSNWTTGTPYTCTDVIIPSKDNLVTTNGVHYPILEEGFLYYCDGIHFKPGAEVVRQELLQYTQAWISVSMTPEKNYMLSVPLTDVYSGDLFIPNISTVSGKDLRNPFREEIIGEINRTKPFFTYQVWNGSWNTLEGLAIVNRKINLCEAIAIKAKKNATFADTTQLEMLFNKADTEYGMYTTTGKPTSDNVTIARSNPGQFIIPHTKGQPMKGFDVILTATTPQTTFAVANPFMSHLDIDMFLACNASVASVKVNSNIQNNPESENNNSKLTIFHSGDGGKVTPTVSFFIEALVPATELTITFTKDMMVPGSYAMTPEIAAPHTRAVSQGSDNNSKLSLSSLKAYAQNGEGVIESVDKIQKLQVFTVAGRLIIEKPNVNSPVRIPLSEGVNMIRVQTENETKTFKLIK